MNTSIWKNKRLRQRLWLFKFYGRTEHTKYCN